MGGGGGGGDGEPEFQIAPMIDVLLTLLIFFMSITTAQVEQADKSIKLPVAPKATERKPTKHTEVINISWDVGKQKATVKLRSKEYDDMTELQEFLKAKKEADERAEVNIRGDKELPAREIQKVMQAAGAAGIDKIGYATWNTDS
jgi:biopolymer transport protein ExbD